ncbi:MAG: ligase-associated DNA damage response endonuclease PdeM [Pseudomonadota bacterium]
MSTHCIAEIAGCELWLLADKALYWPQEQLLCIADAHFGKAATYRALGQPVPAGTTEHNLRRLDALLALHPVQHLVFLGDFLHAPKAHAPATLAALHGWRQQHPALRITLIRGNHDQRAGDPPGSLGIEIVNEPLAIGPLRLRHTPGEAGDGHVIAGHVHPVVTLQGRGRQSLRLPCFYSTARCTLLPSFGAFTGGYGITAEPGSRVFVTDGSGIWPLPTR